MLDDLRTSKGGVAREDACTVPWYSGIASTASSSALREPKTCFRSFPCHRSIFPLVRWEWAITPLSLTGGRMTAPTTLGERVLLRPRQFDPPITQPPSLRFMSNPRRTSRPTLETRATRQSRPDCRPSLAGVGGFVLVRRRKRRRGDLLEHDV